MIVGIQLIGLLFGIGMLYFTFLYFKRGDYDRRGFLVWTIVWIFFIFLTLFPRSLYELMYVFSIERTVDFFVMVGFAFFSVIIFRLYVQQKKIMKKIETVVRKVALDKAKKR